MTLGAAPVMPEKPLDGIRPKDLCPDNAHGHDQDAHGRDGITVLPLGYG